MRKIKLLTVIYFLCISQTIYGQIDTLKESDIHTQGQREAYWAAQLFLNREQQVLEKFKGIIKTLGDSLVSYDSISFNLYGVPKDIRCVFQKGIIHPDLFILGRRQLPNSIRTKPTQSASVPYIFDLNSYSIGYFSELLFSNLPSTIKRYKMYVWTKGFANPNYYILELTNDGADETTDRATFMKNVRLTYFRFVSVLI